MRPIKLRLDGEELHLVSERDLARWGGTLHGRRAAHTLVTPQNIGELRHALLVPRSTNTEGVFTELRKQLEDGSALFFEVPPAPIVWDDPPVIDIHDLLPDGGDDSLEPDRPTPQPGLHWVEVVCISADGGAYPGARARVRLPDGRSEYATLDGRSSVRFDDLTEGGTMHFELSGDAFAQGKAEVPVGQRYTLGGSIGLVTGRRHVLIVHPNPNAFVSVELFADDQPVSVGRYTLTTAAGDQAGALAGEAVRAEGFPLPSAGSYAFEDVILPSRSVDDVSPHEDPDAPTPLDPDAPHPGDDPSVGPDIDPSPPPLGPDTLEPSQVAIAVSLGDVPLAGAQLRLNASGDERSEAADATGTVRFDGLPSGQAELHIEVSPEALPARD